ncbi:MAG: DNA alkylation repair protein [Alphaproteobacteria bacterium]|nr:DNA alkylation repair protein [Rhizobiaceae bacterium]MBU3960739.1 DNA alkylation repair protein [Alphaproteobacteria bacterium]MBU4049813.1 DNA alkylation repair protein [Alphaproteobacteria bacterium]MBU4090421.1 DNA alkylation repair protein [Alphaproteobacteria bacterium]MBU4155120.1 DNA alkylation repair protein [Alphaproteobacteria bacterium]
MTLTPASSVDEIVTYLQSLRNEANIAGMARFGIDTTTALGITTPQMQALVRQVKRDQRRALALWGTGLRDARMLAILTADPKALSANEVRAWAGDFNSWEIVDTAADLFTDTPYWRDLVTEFAADEREYVRRTAFAMIAGATVHNKDEPDQALLGYLPLIEKYATDPRNFVRKAVNWALRNIGKRNRTCHAPALALAEKLAASDDRTARWIGKDAVRELRSEKILKRLKP